MKRFRKRKTETNPRLKFVFILILLLAVVLPTTVSAGTIDSAPRLKDLLTNVMLWTFEVVGLLALVSFVIAGIMYHLAAGNEKQMTDAKTILVYSILGVVVALSAIIILRAIDKAISAQPFI